jgi:hypothetical protein
VRPGDLVRFRREYLDPDDEVDKRYVDALGIITSDQTSLLDAEVGRQLFNVLVTDHEVGAFDYELEQVQT